MEPRTWEEMSCTLFEYLIFSFCMLVLFNTMRAGLGPGLGSSYFISYSLIFCLTELGKHVVFMYQVFINLSSC